MGMTSTIRGYGTTARFRAETMGHRVKDRMLEKRLERANHETDRLRFENEMLRDEVEDARSEHHRILEMLDERLPENGNGRSHKGRWLLLLLALGGGAFAVFRQLRPDRGEWTPDDAPVGTTA
jgi:hypothetical protein